MKKKTNLWLGIIFGVILFSPNILQAAGLVPCGGPNESVCTLCDLIVGFHNLTTYLTGLLVTVTLAGLFFAGVMYMLSVGDDGMMTTAKNFAKASLTGFIVVLGAWLMVNVTMWVISADISKIKKTNWYTFTCS